MVRLWYKDGTYMDVPRNQVEYYDSDPEFDHSEYLTEAAEDDDDVDSK